MKTRCLFLLGSLIFVGLARAEELPPAQADTKQADPKQADPKQTDPKQAAPEFKNVADKASYGIGYQVGQELRGQGMKVSLEMLLRGMQDALALRKPALPDKERLGAISEYSRGCLTELAKVNKEKGQAFLKSNGAKKGVVTLDSGIQYRVLKQGDGATPTEADTVRVHYHGTLPDGTVFDSSLEGEPYSTGVTDVIPGWTEVLKRMKVGDKWQVVLPSDQAYGMQGSPPVIPPNSVLIFEMELMGIAK